MKSLTFVTLLAVSLLAVLYAAPEDKKPTEGAPPAPATPPEAGSPQSVREKASYAIGFNIGRQFKAQGLGDLDLKLLLRGIEESLAGKKSVLTDADIQATFESYQKEISEKQAAQQKISAEKNKKDGDAFLAENKGKPGVMTLPSGLQYKVVKEGTGPKPKSTDTVKTHYRGTLLDGTEFDSSFSRNEPAEFEVGGVIAGWTEALLLMPVGSKWQLAIPSNLAYGEHGTPDGAIGPNSTLVFEIELLEIVVKEKEK